MGRYTVSLVNNTVEGRYDLTTTDTVTGMCDGCYIKYELFDSLGTDGVLLLLATRYENAINNLREYEEQQDGK